MGHKQADASRYLGHRLSHKGHTPSLRDISAGTQGRNLETETKAVAMEKRLLWVCSIDLLSLYSYAIPDHLSRGGTTYN